MFLSWDIMTTIPFTVSQLYDAYWFKIFFMLLLMFLLYLIELF